MKLAKVLPRFCIEEHQEIYDRIVVGDYAGALTFLIMLDEMSYGDIIKKIQYIMEILLINLIKQTTRKTPKQSRLIERTIEEITRCNERFKLYKDGKIADKYIADGYYLDDTALYQTLNEAYNWAFRETPEKTQNNIVKTDILDMAMQLIKAEQLRRE